MRKHSLEIDQPAIRARFDELWELVNGESPEGGWPRPESKVLDVLTFMDLQAPEGLLMADRHGADEFYQYAEIRNGKYTLKAEYRQYKVKDAAKRKEMRQQWRRENKAEIKARTPRKKRKPKR
jgi:hypothetical protein